MLRVSLIAVALFFSSAAHAQSLRDYSILGSRTMIVDLPASSQCQPHIDETRSFWLCSYGSGYVRCREQRRQCVVPRVWTFEQGNQQTQTSRQFIVRQNAITRR
ncbi:MAG: hypothetical protein AB7J28_16075 [Hyphomonadaceae bacterium]